MKITLYILFMLIPLNIKALERIVVTASERLVIASRDTMLLQVGVTELTGKNDGVQVERYLRSVGLLRGNPYCAAAQYWCFMVAADALRIPRSEIPIFRTGGTSRMFNEARKRGVVTVGSPKVNDLMFWRRPNCWRGHVERVIEVRRAGWVRTVGFNTSSGIRGSQDDGGGVFIRNRNVHHVLGRLVVRGFIGFKAGA